MLMNVNAVLRESRLALTNLSDQPMKHRGLQAGLIRLGRKEGRRRGGEASGSDSSLSRARRGQGRGKR